MKNKNIFEEITVLKGLAIIGLIILHIHPPLISPAVTYGLKITVAPYSMEMFMFASGFLFGISKYELFSFSDFYALTAKKFKRLVIPYFVISGIILALKIPAQQFVTLLAPVGSDFWRHLFFDPVGGFATFLWFLYILFFIFLIFPLLYKITRNSVVLFVLLLLIYLVPIAKFDYFNHYLLRWFLLFFYSGYAYSRCKFESINRYSLPLCILLTTIVVLITREIGTDMDFLHGIIGEKLSGNLLRFVTAILGTFAFYYLSVVIKTYKSPLFQLLKYLGTYSASVYLLHTISMAGVRIIFIDLLNVDENFFPVISVLIFISGIILPIYITKHIIYKFKMLPPLILGVNKDPRLRAP